MRRPIQLFALVSTGLLGSCVGVQGGATEFYWSIRTDDGGSCTCANASIGTIELWAIPCDTLSPTGECTGSPQHRNTWAWDCSTARGTTEFDIAEGRWAFYIKARSPNDVPVDVTVPAPIVRDVVSGEVAMLDALQITTPTCHMP